MFTATITKADKPAIDTTAEIGENLATLLTTVKPATRNPYDENSGENETPALKAARFIAVKFGAIIAKDPARKDDIFTLHLDPVTGNNAKSGYDVTLTREAARKYATDLIEWSKLAPGNPGVSYIVVDSRKSTTKAAAGEVLDNE